MASRSPLMVFSLAMFSRKPVGKLFTLDWVVCRADNAGKVRMAVIPSASRENMAARLRESRRKASLHREEPCSSMLFHSLFFMTPPSIWG